MTRLKVVYDTNIVVSANLKPGSLPASLVALALGEQVKLFYSPPIFEEYRAVLARPKFGFDPKAIATFLRDLRNAGEVVRPIKSVTVALHEPDNRFLECAQTARADYVLTGNKRHFPFSVFGKTRIVSPAEFALVVAKELSAQARKP